MSVKKTVENSEEAVIVIESSDNPTGDTDMNTDLTLETTTEKLQGTKAVFTIDCPFAEAEANDPWKLNFDK